MSSLKNGEYTGVETIDGALAAFVVANPTLYDKYILLGSINPRTPLL